MKNFIRLVAALVATVTLTSFVFARTSEPAVKQSMIVSTDWLAKHLNDEGLVLLQVGDKKEFDAAHIPGAQYIQTSDISTPRGQGLILELPPVNQLKATVREVRSHRQIARESFISAKTMVTPTSRVYFTLDYLGCGRSRSAFSTEDWCVGG